MAEFTASMGFIIFFLVMCMFISLTAGEEILVVFLTLILLGMVITNPDKIGTFISRFSTPNKAVVGNGGAGSQLMTQL